MLYSLGCWEVLLAAATRLIVYLDLVACGDDLWDGASGACAWFHKRIIPVALKFWRGGQIQLNNDPSWGRSDAMRDED